MLSNIHLMRFIFLYSVFNISIRIRENKVVILLQEN